MQHSESGLEDLSSLRQDVISAIMGEKYDSVREGLQIEEPHRSCVLAQFDAGNDIARQSFKRVSKNIKSDKEVNINMYYYAWKIKEFSATANFERVRCTFLFLKLKI